MLAKNRISLAEVSRLDQSLPQLTQFAHPTNCKCIQNFLKHVPEEPTKILKHVPEESIKFIKIQDLQDTPSIMGILH